MKKMIFATALLLSSYASAYEFNLVSNKHTGADLCPQIMSVKRSGDTIVIGGSRDLAEKFSFNELELGSDELVISNINKGLLKKSGKNSSHGDAILTRSEATYQNDVLQLSHETKFGRVVSSKARGDLKMSFSEGGVLVEIERSYDEAFSSSSDWNSSQSCEYKLTK